MEGITMNRQLALDVDPMPRHLRVSWVGPVAKVVWSNRSVASYNMANGTGGELIQMFDP